MNKGKDQPGAHHVYEGPTHVVHAENGPPGGIIYEFHIEMNARPGRLSTLTLKDESIYIEPPPDQIPPHIVSRRIT